MYAEIDPGWRLELLERVLARLGGQEGADHLLLQPPTIFHGWPGIAWMVHSLGRSGQLSEPLTYFCKSWQSRLAPVLTEPKLPPDMPEGFLLGGRGLAWASQCLGDPITPDLRPPPHPIGYDSCLNDAFLHFGVYHLPSSARASQEREGYTPVKSVLLADWAQCVERQFQEMVKQIHGAAPVMLGFSHGVAGILTQLLHLHTQGQSPIVMADILYWLEWLMDQAKASSQGVIWPFRLGDELALTSPFRMSLCNGSLGHTCLLLDAYLITRDNTFLQLALTALAGVDDTAMGMGFCCGHAGKVAIVSRFLRSGLSSHVDDVRDCWARLLLKLYHHVDMTNLSCVTGLGSCVPALCADGPDSSLLDYYLPPLPEVS